MRRRHVPGFMWREFRYRWRLVYSPAAKKLLRRVQQQTFRRP